MKYLIAFFYLLLILVPYKGSAQPAPCSSLKELHWLVGDWHSESEQQTVLESWQISSDRTLEGEGQTLTAKGTFVESLRLLEMSQQVFFLAKTPGNHFPVPFKAEVCGPNYVKFENQQHDFPTSLEYRLKSNYGLHVKVRGSDGKGFDIHFTKVN